MEKWKIGVIVFLLGALAAYGSFQQKAAQTPPAGDQNTPQPTPKPINPKLQKLQGQTPPAWNFAASSWVNTPKPISLASLKGSVALLEFWRIGCPHCEEAAPALAQLYAQYKPRGLKIVAIHSPGAPGADNPENNWSGVRQTIKAWGIPYPIAYDEGGKLFKDSYGGETYPTFVVLDRAGKVASIIIGHNAAKHQALVAALEKALKAK